MWGESQLWSVAFGLPVREKPGLRFALIGKGKEGTKVDENKSGQGDGKERLSNLLAVEREATESVPLSFSLFPFLCFACTTRNGRTKEEIELNRPMQRGDDTTRGTSP